MMVEVSAPGFSIDRVESLTLSMRANLPPTGHVRVRYDASVAAALGVCGSAVSIRMTLPGPIPVGQPVLAGTVSDAILREDGVAVLTVLGKSAQRDETVRVRSFGTGPGRVAIKSLSGIAELLAGVGNSTRLSMPVSHLYQFGRTDYEVLQLLAGWHGLYLREDPTGTLCFADHTDGALHTVPRSALVPRSTTLHVHKRPAGARCVSTDLLAEKTPSRPANAAPCANPGTPLAAAAHSLGACRPHDFYGGGAGLTDAERAGRAAAAVRGGLTAWRAVLNGPLATQVRVGDRLKLADSEITDVLLVRQSELTYTPAHRDSLSLAIDAVPVGPLGGIPVSATPGPVVAVIGTCLDDPDESGRAWVRVAFPWHESGDGIWCPVAQATASKPGCGAAEVPAAGASVVALLDPIGFDPPTIVGAIYRGAGGGQPTTGTRRILHASPGLRLDIDQETGTLTFQGKLIRFLGPVTISETLDVKEE
ncbi:MAG: hypothetical protein IPN34_17615 [Planctomycetes bacterium]|nr:hypothetical protein [Planctomycetota bacterium]